MKSHLVQFGYHKICMRCILSRWGLNLFSGSASIRVWSDKISVGHKHVYCNTICIIIPIGDQNCMEKPGWWYYHPFAEISGSSAICGILGERTLVTNSYKPCAQPWVRENPSSIFPPRPLFISGQSVRSEWVRFQLGEIKKLAQQVSVRESTVYWYQVPSE